MEKRASRPDFKEIKISHRNPHHRLYKERIEESTKKNREFDFCFSHENHYV